MSAALVTTALDPGRSVVVEACAGSGKTWLLVSRLLRLLLAGVAPGEILAITYTRKAAAEIEARLRLWLRQLAVLEEGAALAFLSERGLTEAQARAALPLARGLVERVMQASPPMTVTTFHGWFGRLLGGAAFSSGLAGFALAEAEGPILEEAWALFAQRCAAAPEAPEAVALLALLERLGQHNTRLLLNRFVGRRAEWHAFLDDGAMGLDFALASLRDALGVEEAPCAMARFLATPGFAPDLAAYAGLLARNGKRDADYAARIALALEETEPARRFAGLRAVLLTGEGAVRVRKPSGAQAGRLGADGELSLLDLHARLGEGMRAAVQALVEEAAYACNRDAFTAATALLEALERYKRERRLMDFADLEWHADRLLRDPDTAPFIQARLDARYRHILLDEFQDTNPLQWRILRAWLEAYGSDGERPRLFLVGDPKQSIYRFRRADYRIFLHARDWLGEHYGAAVLENDVTFRNAPAIVEVVNALFGAEPAFVGFRPQRARRDGLPGRVELLPLEAADEAGAEEEGAAVADGPLRNPLTEPAAVAEDVRRRGEARRMVMRLAELVGRVRIEADDGPRPAGWGDVLILTRRRGILPEYERALREAGIPYLSVSRGGLLRTLEAADLIALVRCLADPGDRLALAHVLRTPLFDVTDDDLLALAGGEGDWWRSLRDPAATATRPSLARAGRLLEAWRALAGHLPVHDLLDRVYHEGELMRRYRDRVPAAMWAGVQANLEAFIALALQVDGGRYPSLTRFVDELLRLERAGDDEAPDEGVLAAAAEGEGRLRIMTVHGAKGLEAPIVWLIDARNNHQVADGYQPLLEWPPSADRPSHFSLLTTRAECGEARARLLADEAAAREREELNLLYVAITRARQAFFASGIEPARDGAAPSFYGRIAAALERLGAADGAWGAPLPAWEESARPAGPAEAEGGRAIVLGSGTDCGKVGERVTVVEETAAIAFGVRLHALLERRTASATMAGEEETDADVRRTAETILAAPGLARFFDPEAYVEAHNELEFVRPDGSLGRIDRLVVFADEIWVLDYKSGSREHAPMAAYRAQLEGYREVVREWHPDRPVRCGLIFGDASLVAF